MRNPLRTSQTHPLQVPLLEVPGGGRIGITFCPGKHQRVSMTGGWARDLRIDLERIRSLGVSVLVSLIEEHEFSELKVKALGDTARQMGLGWHHLPIRDREVPTAAWEQQWRKVSAELHTRLDTGETLVIHCKGGLGRAGTVAARLLVERGESAASAVTRIRSVRPGAIETREQEAHVHAVAVHLRAGDRS